MTAKDRGMSYEDALHAMQSSVAFEMTQPHRRTATEPKHLRVGINAAMSDHAALVRLLIAKGVFTEAEYLEAIRLEMNNEAASYEGRIGGSLV